MTPVTSMAFRWTCLRSPNVVVAFAVCLTAGCKDGGVRHASSSGRGGAAPEPGVESDAAQPDGGDSESDASSTPRDAGDTSELIAPVQSPWVPHTDDPSPAAS
jgi:hypothetical protein